MSIQDTLRDSFKTYAGMTIMDRAICDVRDCLKPSVRMSIYSQFIDKITPNNPYKKSQKSVASAMDHFYVHGDMSLYPMLARMGKPFAMRYMLEDFYGNTGTIECGDNEAASRYTEMRLAPISMNLFNGIDKETIDKWYDSYTGEEQYPAVLPSVGYYNIVNGTSGIATGISSSVPQFNLKETNEALIKLLWNPELDDEEVICMPDFCTGAYLLNEEEVRESLKTGKGASCKLRSVVSYDNKERKFVVSEIPYGVYTETIRNQLTAIMEDADHNPGVESFGDYSTTVPNIEIRLLPKANPDRVLRFLYKNTSLQYFYPINMIMLDNGKAPRVFSWKEALLAHLTHEIEVYKRSYIFDIRKIEARLHIIDGLLKALDDIDNVIKTIKSSKSSDDAKKALMSEYGFSDIQVSAILSMKLSKLAHLEVESLRAEKKELETEKTRLENILNDETLLKKEVEKGLRVVMEKYGDERRTKIIKIGDEDSEEPTEIRPLTISLSNLNTIIADEQSSLYTQKKGSVGSKFKLDSGEHIISSIQADSNDILLLFSDKGNYYSCDISKIPCEQPTAVEMLVKLGEGETIKAITSFNKKHAKENIVFITKQGLLKKSLLSEYNTRRSGGVKALNMNDGDYLVSVLFTDDSPIAMMTEKGQFVVVNSKDIRPVGRVSLGIKGIKLNDGDNVAAARIVNDSVIEYACISSNGLIKRVKSSDFNIQNTNTKGKRIAKTKDGIMVDFTPVVSTTKEFIVSSNNSQIKIKKEDINLLATSATGSRAMKLKQDAVVVAIESI